MSPAFFLDFALVPALKLLPPEMDSRPARLLVLAICLQESGLKYRTQVGGPARGYPQFERAGISAILTNSKTMMQASTVCGSLDLASDATSVYAAIALNDVLAAAFARLLLFSLPMPLPAPDDIWGAWEQYVEAWRPGKPRRNDWEANHDQALQEVT
jgi:hypothetical protein